MDLPLQDGRTPLFCAVAGPRDRAVSVVRVLIENAHVNVNHVAQHGDTAVRNKKEKEKYKDIKFIDFDSPHHHSYMAALQCHFSWSCGVNSAAG
jgi:hypothetical protein